MNEKLQFFAVFQKLTLIAARVTVVQLKLKYKILPIPFFSQLATIMGVSTAKNE